MISVIVPVYNVEKFIDECLKSLENQTLEKNKYEVLIINDCSTDNSKLLAEKFVSRNSNFKLINNKENLGLSRTRNVGIRNANKDASLLFFVDSDDYVSENYLEKLSVDDNQLHFATMINKWGNTLILENMENWLFRDTNFPIRSSVFLTPWKNNKTFFSDDIRYFEDFYYAIKNSYKLKSKLHNDVFYFYRKNPDSITQSGMSSKKIQDILSEMLKTYQFAKNLDKDDFLEIQSWISKKIIGQIYYWSKWKKEMKKFVKTNNMQINSKKLSLKFKLLHFFIKINCEFIFKPLIVYSKNKEKTLKSN